VYTAGMICATLINTQTACDHSLNKLIG